MADKVTIQDIADALGISRNTASKAINNTGSLADATRERVINKAIEMGYKQFSYVSIPHAHPAEPARGARAEEGGEIALITTRFLGNLHFSSTMLDKFYREISELGYSLSMHLAHTDEIEGLRLPVTFNKERASGIICFEMFSPAYSNMLCSLGIPALFVDCPAAGLGIPLKADRLFMDNRSGIFAFAQEMARRGKKRIGFIGEYMHCQSFFERYMAYRNAMYLLGLPCPDKFCITGNKRGAGPTAFDDYREYLAGRLQKLDSLPDVFICANDFVAIDVLNIFKPLGITVPDDLYLCGFDDSPQSKLTTPSLTTVHIHSQIMGISAVELLISRIREPSLNFRTVHTETSLVYRESTEG